MKLILTLLALSCALFLMGAFAQVAAMLASQGSTWADTVGFTGIGLASVGFVVASIGIWRSA